MPARPLSEQAYSLMLHAYSPEFRMRFGAQAEIVFRDCLHDAQRAGPHAVIVFWFGAIFDLAVSAANERAENLGGLTMGAAMPLFQGLLIFVFVFGAYVIFGGSMPTILEALPDEVMTIVLPALAAHAIARGDGRPGAIRGLADALSGRRFRDSDFGDLVGLLCNEIAQISSRISAHDRFSGDHAIRAMLLDAEFLARHASGAGDAGSVLESRASSTINERMQTVVSLQRLSSLIIGFGIVGVIIMFIKTLTHVTSPPAELGYMVASAFVGALLAAFLSVAIVRPAAGRLSAAIDDDGLLYAALAKGLAAQLSGLSPALAARAAAATIPARMLESPNAILAVQPEAG